MKFPEWQVADEDGEILGIVRALDGRSAAEDYRDTNPDDHEWPDAAALAVRRVDGDRWEHFLVTRTTKYVYRARTGEAPEGWEPEVEP